MIRKINITLAILCTAGAIFVGAIFAYTHLSDIQSSKVVQSLEGGF